MPNRNSLVGVEVWVCGFRAAELKVKCELGNVIRKGHEHVSQFRIFYVYDDSSGGRYNNILDADLRSKPTKKKSEAVIGCSLMM